MVNLILTLISIALVAALVTVTVNYLPWHTRPAADIASSVRDSLMKIDSAYQALVSANDGAAPSPSGNPEESFQQHFVQDLLRFTPAAPAGYTWSYHQFVDAVTPGSVYDGLHYVCLYPPPSRQTDKALEQGLSRAKATFSPEQVTLSDACGATSSQATFTDAPVLTMFLVPAPEFVY